MNAQVQPLVIDAPAILAKTWGGHDVRSEPEEGDEGGDAGELVPGRELRFTDIVLTDEWIDRLIGEKAVHAFFNIVPDKPREPMFKSFTWIPLDTKYKNCEVLITFGVSNSTVKIERATIKNMRVKFTKTGDLALRCTVVGVRPRCIEVIDLEEFAGKPVDVVISFGPIEDAGDQRELPLQQPAANADQQPQQTDAERQADHDRQLEQAAQYHEQQSAA